MNISFLYTVSLARFDVFLLSSRYLRVHPDDDDDYYYYCLGVRARV